MGVYSIPGRQYWPKKVALPFFTNAQSAFDFQVLLMSADYAIESFGAERLPLVDYVEDTSR